MGRDSFTPALHFRPTILMESNIFFWRKLAMAETTGSAAFANLDWSKFDFTRWSLSGLGLDSTSSTVATLLQKVMAAPQWPQSFGSNLPALKTAVMEHLTLQAD